MDRMLIVDPDPARLAALTRAVDGLAAVVGCTEFRVARDRLLADRPDWLVTNLRLGAFNGLHLVHLAPLSTRPIVYMDRPDLPLLREAQRAGAFVESARGLTLALAAYLGAALPAGDRRDPATVDRVLRSGRRAADVLA